MNRLVELGFSNISCYFSQVKPIYIVSMNLDDEVPHDLGLLQDRNQI